jgi:PAS domain S-box-containing protein
VASAASPSQSVRTILERVVDGAPDAALLIDPNGLITRVNDGVVSMFGHPARELLQQPLTMLTTEAHRTRVLEDPAHQAPARMQDGPGLRLEILGRRKDRSELPCALSLTRLGTPAGPYTLATIVDISRHERAAEAQRFLAAVVDHAGDAIIAKSLEGTILSWNPAAERLLGYRGEEIIGRPVTDLIPDDRLAEEAMILERIRQGQQVAHLETVRRRRDGTLVDVALTVSPVRDSSGAVVAASKIMRDTTDRRIAEAAIRQANAHLAEVNRELADFVRTASHDLRAPLMGIGSLVQRIVEDDPTLATQTRERLDVIGGRAARLQRLLADLRDYARAGQLATPSGPQLSGVELLAEVAAGLHVPEGFSIVTDDSLARVIVNRVPLLSVLHNLVGNAIKHHDRGAGVVAVAAHGAGRWIRFSVSDDGPGIPDEFHEIIFGMFQTLKPRDEVEGSGMGLALVRKIVTRVGGRCGIEPNAGRGARFWFEWPQATNGMEH